MASTLRGLILGGLEQTQTSSHSSDSTAHFIANATGPTTAAQEFWFNTSNHTLYFDADGSGSNAHPVAIAQLENNYVLHNIDLLIV